MQPSSASLGRGSPPYGHVQFYVALRGHTPPSARLCWHPEWPPSHPFCTAGLSLFSTIPRLPQAALSVSAPTSPRCGDPQLCSLTCASVRSRAECMVLGLASAGLTFTSYCLACWSRANEALTAIILPTPFMHTVPRLSFFPANRLNLFSKVLYSPTRPVIYTCPYFLYPLVS